MHAPKLLFGILAAVVPSFSFALEPADLSRILDSPEFTFTLTTNAATVSEDSDAQAVGGSSLAFRPVLDPAENRYTLNFTLSAPQSGPGRFRCRVRASKADVGHVHVNQQGAYQLLPEDRQEDTWYQVSFPIFPHNQSIEVAMWPFLDNGDAVFYFDDFQFLPGIAISTEDMPAAGSITLSPKRELYQVGETISVSLQAIDASVSPSILEIDTYNGAVTPRPSEYTITASQDLLLRADYQQTLDLPRLEATAHLVHSVFPANANRVETDRLVLRNLPPNALLAFDATLIDGQSFSIYGENELRLFTLYPTKSNSASESFPNQSFALDYPIDELRFAIETYAPDDYFVIENLRLISEPVVLARAVGRGSVAVSYQEGSAPGSVSSTLTATPEPGWTFLGWTGDIESPLAELEALIDHPHSVTATFAETFTLGLSRWDFIHQGDAQISLLPDNQGLRVEAGPQKDPVTVAVTVSGPGAFSADALGFDRQEQSLPWYFPIDFGADANDHAPRVRSLDLGFSQVDFYKITNLVVSDSEDFASIPFAVNAPEGAVVVEPATDSYQFGDPITLKVTPAYLDRFIAWTGPIHSTETEFAFTLFEPTTINAVFEEPTSQNVGPYALENSGSFLLGPPTSSSPLAFPTQSIPAKSWTEISLQLESAQAVGITLQDSVSNFSFRAWLDEQELPPSAISKENATTYINSIDPEGGELRIRMASPYAEPRNATISKLALYHDSHLWQTGNPQDYYPFGNYRVTPDRRFHEIGSTVTLNPSPRDSQTFVGWDSPATLGSDSQYTLPDRGPIRIKPRFDIANQPEGVQFLLARSTEWSADSNLSLTASEPFVSNDTIRLALEVTGPGLLTFEDEHFVPFFDSPANTVNLRVFDDGLPARHWDDPSTPNYPNDHRVLVEPGSHLIEILLTRTDAAIEEGVTIIYSRLKNFQYHRGFAVLGLPDFPYQPTVTPLGNPPVYAEGATVTVGANQLGEAPFGGWVGDLSGSPATVQISLDRHIVSNPVESNNRQSGFLSSRISNGAIFSSTAGGDYIGYWIENRSGPTSVSFNYPALTELNLVLNYIQGSVTVTANGQLAYQGDFDEYLELSFPAKETAQRVEVTLTFTRLSATQPQTSLSASATQRFELSGAFGSAQEYVIPDPAKDLYVAGEKVTVKLGNGVPSDSVFYDVAVAYPTLNTVEWLSIDGQKSFEIEMGSHAVLLGRVGKLPNRTRGSLAPGYDLSFSASNLKTPDGRTARRGTLTTDFSTLRIATLGAKRINFWIQLPTGTDLIFNEIEADGLPLAIVGNGLWQKASLTVPAGATYVNAFLSALYPEIEFLVSDIATADTHGIDYLLTGNSTITQSPAGGVASPNTPITLKLQIAEGFSLDTWYVGGPDAETIALKPSDKTFLMPTLLPDPVFTEQNGISFLLEGATQDPATGSIVFTDPSHSATALVNGPARITFQAEEDSFVGFSFALDGYPGYTAVSLPELYEQKTNEILVPSGSHLLELQYVRALPNATGSVTLTNLTFEAGSYVLFQTYQQNGTVSSATPSGFIPSGEAIQLTANPDFGYAFESWGGDLSGSSADRNLHLQPTSHVTAKANFRVQTDYSAYGLDWSVTSRAKDQDLHTASTVVSGPGYLTIHTNFAHYRNFETRIDGLLAAHYKNGVYYYLPVPAGKHYVEFTTNQLFPGQYGSIDFHRGYLFLLYGESDYIMSSPIQNGHLPGSQVTLFLNQFAAESSLSYLVGDQTLSGSDTLIVPMRRHTLLATSRAKPLLGTGFSTNAASTRLSAFAGADGPRFELAPTFGQPSFLQRELEGPATVTFQLNNVADHLFSVLVDGLPALSSLPDGEHTLKLPSGLHRVRWQIESARYESAHRPSAISGIRSEPTLLDEFETWLSATVPAHLFARNVDLAPAADLDRDGLSNATERANNTPPHEFNLFASIAITAENKPLAVFSLPEGIPTDSVSLYLYENKQASAYWNRHALSDLAFTSSQTKGQTHYAVDLTQFSKKPDLLKVSVLTP